MEAGHRRGRQNQGEFRHANTRFAEVMSGPNEARDGQLIPFLCECADSECRGHIPITTSRYDAMHLDDRDYVILPHHTRIAGEEILEENGFYEVVRKAA
jgi:hypothetical protein